MSSTLKPKFTIGERVRIVRGDFEGLFGIIHTILPTIYSKKVQAYSYYIDYENLPRFSRLVGNGFKERELEPM